MKNENFITILGWMINNLALRGNELLCYATIFGFSQDGESKFNGSRKYLANIIGASSLNTVDKVLKSLIDKGLIIKNTNTINGVIFNSYNANLEVVSQENNCTPRSNNEHPCSENEHNNNSNINSNKEIEDNKLSSTKKGIDDFVDRMYKLYPTKCPKRNCYLGKSNKDKQRIKTLLKIYSKEQIEQVFNNEIEEKYNKQYMQNFSTFLNNFPDPDTICIVEKETELQNSNDVKTLSINGQIYR